MSIDQPFPQPEQPEIRPIFDPENLKAKYGKLETLKETLDAVKEAKAEALKDIEEDITRLYPDDTDEHKTKRENEIKAVEKMLERLEKSYLKAAKGSVAESTPENPGLYEFGDLIDEYFEELQSITGDKTPDTGTVDLTTVDPYKFWEDTVGWYEKTEGTGEFKEGKIEEEGERWKEAIHSFKEENSNKIKEEEKENFQAWIETHREDLRRVILRQIDDRKYIIDFTNLSKEFGKSLAGNARDADFIAKNIGLADLFTDISQAVTVWKGDNLYTGQLNKDFERKNGLKGGYFHNGNYLDIWHGAIISTKYENQIYDPDKGEEELPADMFEAQKEKKKLREESSFPVIQQAVGDKVVNLKYEQGIDEKGETTPVQRKIIEESVETREKALPLKLNYEYGEVYGTRTINKTGETTFEKQSSPPDYSNINNEIVYTSKEFPNIEIVIPFSKTDCYLLRTKTQKNNTETPIATVYEFADIEELKVQLGKEVGIQEKSAKKTLGNSDVKVLKLTETCSEKTTKSQIRKSKENYENSEKVIVYGSVPTGFVPEETKISDSELTQDGIDKLPIDEKNKDVKVEKGKSVSEEDLSLLLSKTPEATKLTLSESNLYKGALFAVASLLNGTLEELDLSYSGFTLSDLRYLESCTKLNKLTLAFTAVTDFEVGTYISNLAGLTNLNLSNTKITDKSLEALAKLENLTNLDLSGTDTSLKATVELQRALGCEIKYSEKAERELKDLVDKEVERVAKEQEKNIAEDLKTLLEADYISVKNTKFDPENMKFNADIYFGEEKVASTKLTVEITERNGTKPMAAEDLYKKLVIFKDPRQKVSKDKSQDNPLKYEAKIDNTVVAYIEKIYEFTDTDGKELNKEKIKGIIKEKQELKEKIAKKLEKPEETANNIIATDLKEKKSEITFQNAHSDQENKIFGYLMYKEKSAGQIEIDFSDPDSPKHKFYMFDKNNNKIYIKKEKIIENCTKIDKEIAKEKEEEEKKAKEEAVEKQNALKKRIIKGVNALLQRIDVNLKTDTAITKDSTVESGRKYLQIPITYFGENIGRISPWADIEFKNQVDTDIWVELETETVFERIKEGKLQERLVKLKEKAIEQKREEKAKEFQNIIEEANKEIFGEHYAGDRLSLDSEGLNTIKYSKAEKRPYLRVKVYFEETIPDMSGFTSEPTTKTKHIGYLDDWIIGELKTAILDTDGKEITEGSTIAQKLEKLKDAED